MPFLFLNPQSPKIIYTFSWILGEEVSSGKLGKTWIGRG